MPSVKMRTGLAVAAAVCLALITTTPAQAATTPPDGTVMLYSAATDKWYAGAPILDPTITGGPAAPRKDLVQPNLNPGTIAACNAGLGETVVASMTSLSDGTVNLRCGDSASGYVHIRSRHATSWANQMGGPGLWDDYMVWATTNALASPSMVKPQPGNKNCYTTPISVYRTVDGKPKFWKVFNPSVVVSVNNKKVITSIPTTTTNC